MNASVTPISPAHLMVVGARMTDAEYEAERAKLRDVYGETSVEAGAKRDQALAKLFHRSGWTQEELAAKESKSQSQIQRQLLFGRFLNFTPMGVNVESLPSSLTERRFRTLWEQTDKDAAKEEYRFRAVIKI